MRLRCLHSPSPYLLPHPLISFMKIQTFLEHHGIRAQSVRRGRRADRSGVQGTLHRQRLSPDLGQDLRRTRPTPPRRSSSAKRGPARRRCGCKSSRHLEEYNRQHPDARLFVDRVRRLQSVPRSLSRQAQPAASARRPRARRVEAVGPHGRDPVAGRHASSSIASSPATSRWPRIRRRSTATRRAICCCWPPATTSRRPRPPRAAGTGCGARCAFRNWKA